MDYPLREKFSLDITHEDQKITLEYEEASMEEMFEFIASNQTEWILKKFSDQILPEAMVVLLPNIQQTILDTLFKGCFSAEQKNERPKTIFASILVYLAEKCNLPPHILLKKYTYRQFSYLLDGIVWNANEQTKE